MHWFGVLGVVSIEKLVSFLPNGPQLLFDSFFDDFLGISFNEYTPSGSWCSPIFCVLSDISGSKFFLKIPLLGDVCYHCCIFLHSSIHAYNVLGNLQFNYAYNFQTEHCSLCLHSNRSNIHWTIQTNKYCHNNSISYSERLQANTTTECHERKTKIEKETKRDEQKKMDEIKTENGNFSETLNTHTNCKMAAKNESQECENKRIKESVNEYFVLFCSFAFSLHGSV